MAKVLFITSSWRKSSNSSWLAERAAEAARENGHEVTITDIAKLNIGPCRACMGCRKTQDGRCILKDDMGQFYPMLEEADVVVFTSPVYWFNLCGQIKQFIDRCYALGGKEFPDGTNCFSRKKIGLVLAHEGEDPYDSGGINAIRSIQDTCSYLGATFAGALYGSANDAAKLPRTPRCLRKPKSMGLRCSLPL